MSQQLMSKNNEVKVLTEQVQDLEGTVLDWKSKHTKIQASLQQLREANDKLKDSQKILEKAEVEKGELDKRCSQYFETMKAQEEEITTLRTNLQDVTTDKQKLETTFEEKEQTFKAEIERLKLAAQKASIQASSMSNLSSTRAPPPAQLDVNASFNGN
jgi:DNA repair exonuclease SbcCD ATPase subunit